VTKIKAEGIGQWAGGRRKVKGKRKVNLLLFMGIPFCLLPSAFFAPQDF
jgi:hypothetical protein